MENFYTVIKTRPGADCGSDHELLIEKFTFIEESRKSPRLFMCDVNQILYDIQWK